MQLFITTYGAYLHIQDGMFQVRFKNGDTEIKKKIPPKKISSIVLDKGTALSYEAVKTALAHNIDIVFTEGDGIPLGRIWHSKLGSTTKIRKRQLEASIGPEAVSWVTQWLAEKAGRQCENLRELKKHRKPHETLINEAISKIEAQKGKIENFSEHAHIDEIADSLRGYEGTAGRWYFQTLSALLPSAYRFKGRSFRPANDPFNAFLNYGYGMLYARIEKVLMLAGLDPYVGFMHRDDYNQKSFVFDFIEPYRPFVDLTIYRLFSGKKVQSEHHEAITNGTGLTKSGKELIVTAFIQRFDTETIRYRGRNLTRMHAIQMDAHQFANKLISSPVTDVPSIDLMQPDLPF
ncbi:MAG: CRISPR-associated endonuclease Cas1 [Candidatus Cyclonatronum sp.]|uniref:CRISPR-associated endonuclease Cas1 n=1 Tax=Cyclonatronum sp. TaxID=3024185 RepID=UPI0025B85167|nr:CRISPR-associated endonuclease Cas1 [Cyclonatronum sp.]MCC5935389.1 CRISPR-associated endonuclease Cas1 [Balneolales bacterium]MCH8487665.1 CRISPR-associated endonuclease Cas1 [Cyclonatronum sp.]